MFIQASTGKKQPRILSSQFVDQRKPLIGVQWIWPDRQKTEILDLNLAGALVGTSGQISKLKLGQSMLGKLEISSRQLHFELDVKLMQWQGSYAGLAFDSLNPSRRISLEQGLKDQLVILNIRKMNEFTQMPYLKGMEWYHAPFDTNFYLWPSQPGYSLEKLIIEYDHLFWILEPGKKVQVFKSGAASEPGKAYLPWMDLSQNLAVKTSIGKSWKDRLQKILTVMIDGGHLNGAEESFRLVQHALSTEEV